MFTQAIFSNERFAHLANDELAIIREETLNKLQVMRRRRDRARCLDLEEEAQLIEEELTIRKYPRYFNAIRLSKRT